MGRPPDRDPARVALRSRRASLQAAGDQVRGQASLGAGLLQPDDDDVAGGVAGGDRAELGAGGGLAEMEVVGERLAGAREGAPVGVEARAVASGEVGPGGEEAAGRQWREAAEVLLAGSETVDLEPGAARRSVGGEEAGADAGIVPGVGERAGVGGRRQPAVDAVVGPGDDIAAV